MQYTNLGRTGLKVSRFVLGTMNFGELTDEKTAFEIMDRAVEAGINFFDTADVYGGPQSPNMKKDLEFLKKLLVDGYLKVTVVIESFLELKCTNRWKGEKMIVAFHLITLKGRARQV